MTRRHVALVLEHWACALKVLVLDEGRSRGDVRRLGWMSVRARVCEQRRTVQTRFASRRELA